MKLRGMLFLGVIAVGAGCATSPPATEAVLTGTEGDAIRQNLERQAEAGARNDPALYGVHFTGPRLNSLGQRKIDLILQPDSAADPVDLYLAGGTDSDDHRDAVAAYLKRLGTAEGKVRLNAGDSPAPKTLATRGLADLPKADTSPASGPADAAAGDASSWVTAPGAAVKEAAPALAGK